VKRAPPSVTAAEWESPRRWRPGGRPSAAGPHVSAPCLSSSSWRPSWPCSPPQNACLQMLGPPQSLHLLLMRPCSQMPAPPQSLHPLLWRLSPAVLALSPLAVVLADAGAPAVVAPAPDAVMLADAGAPAVLALVPLAVVLAFLAPPPRLRCAHPLSLPPPFRAGGRGRR